ncbi:MAG: hypothetical protein ABR573_01505, partial [Candidatus Dormibacteria bacterium]
MSTTRRRTRRTPAPAAPRKGSRGGSRTRRPAARARSTKSRTPRTLRIPEIQLTEPQRREGLGLLLIVLAAIFALAILFRPGAGLVSLRGFLLDAVGLGWVAIVLIMVGGGIALIGGRSVGAAEAEGETVRASRNQVVV